MISVITMTYKRHKVLEEAIQSFLEQDFEDCEMVVLNDADVIYQYDHPKVRVINHPTRFDSIGEKLEFGMKQCKGDYIYRLDDDDLLTPWGLSLMDEMIKANPGYDIYRCSNMYFFNDNRFREISCNVNNGNVFTKEFINRIDFPHHSTGEDLDLVYKLGGSICEKDMGKHSMIYRWGSFTYHISAHFGARDMKAVIETQVNESGVIVLNPSFKNDYYSQISDINKT